MTYKSDIEIAQECRMLPITEIASRAHVDEKYVEQYGEAKPTLDAVRELIEAMAEQMQKISDNFAAADSEMAGQM